MFLVKFTYEILWQEDVFYEVVFLDPDVIYNKESLIYPLYLFFFKIHGNKTYNLSKHIDSF